MKDNNVIVAPIISRGKKFLFVGCAPRTLSICLNSDGIGTSKGGIELAGGGGVIRDYIGSFIRAFSTIFSGLLSLPIKAKIFEAALGLEIAKNLGFTKLVLLMDNQACIGAFQNTDHL